MFVCYLNTRNDKGTYGDRYFDQCSISLVPLKCMLISWAIDMGILWVSYLQPLVYSSSFSALCVKSSIWLCWFLMPACDHNCHTLHDHTRLHTILGCQGCLTRHISQEVCIKTKRNCAFERTSTFFCLLWSRLILSWFAFSSKLSFSVCWQRRAPCVLVSSFRCLYCATWPRRTSQHNYTHVCP